MASQPLIVFRQGGRLCPATPGTQEAIARIPNGQLATIKIKRPRSLKWHRRYWALVSIVADNSLHYPEEVHELLKIRTGLIREIRERDGTLWRIPDSTAWERMDNTAWAMYWDRVVDVVLQDFIPISREQLQEELAAVCGLHPEMVNPKHARRAA